MQTLYLYRLIGSTVTVVTKQGLMHCNRDNPIFAPLMNALRNTNDPNRGMVIEGLLNPSNVIFENFSGLSNGDLKIFKSHVTYKGLPLKSAVVDRVLESIQMGIVDYSYLNFLANCLKNPSELAINELFAWLEVSKLPVMQDGRFIAIKKVKLGKDGNYWDVHTFDHSTGKGTVRYNLGDIPEMDRKKVDANRRKHCSAGLHFCSPGYLFGSDAITYFGSKDDPIVIVAVSPADVVSIPNDYKNTKGRACKFEVLSLCTGKNVEELSSAILIGGSSEISAKESSSDVAVEVTTADGSKKLKINRSSIEEAEVKKPESGEVSISDVEKSLGEKFYLDGRNFIRHKSTGAFLSASELAFLNIDRSALKSILVNLKTREAISDKPPVSKDSPSTQASEKEEKATSKSDSSKQEPVKETKPAPNKSASSGKNVKKAEPTKKEKSNIKADSIKPKKPDNSKKPEPTKNSPEAASFELDEKEKNSKKTKTTAKKANSDKGQKKPANDSSSSSVADKKPLPEGFSFDKNGKLRHKGSFVSEDTKKKLRSEGYDV